MFVDQFLTSKHSHRSNHLYSVLSQLISELHSLNPNHTLVFSASKEFSNILHNTFSQTNLETSPFLESESSENQIIVDQLKDFDHSLIFASFGGSFSEGIETKDRITKKSKITLIIFTGVPLSAPT
jgi:Rad3-related DNA helicase